MNDLQASDAPTTAELAQRLADHELVIKMLVDFVDSEHVTVHADKGHYQFNRFAFDAIINSLGTLSGPDPDDTPAPPLYPVPTPAPGPEELTAHQMCVWALAKTLCRAQNRSDRAFKAAWAPKKRAEWMEDAEFVLASPRAKCCLTGAEPQVPDHVAYLLRHGIDPVTVSWHLDENGYFDPISQRTQKWPAGFNFTVFSNLTPEGRIK